MKKEIAIALLLTLCAVIFLSPFVSRLPDILEKVAQEKHFSQQGKDFFIAPLAGYAVAPIKNKTLTTACAGAVGIAAAFLLGCSLAFLFKKKGRK